jgi:hypothetical protein
VAACFPTGGSADALQTFDIVFALDHIPIKRIIDVDEALYHGPRVSILDTAKDIADGWAEELSTLSLADDLGASSPLGQVQLIEPVYASKAFHNNMMVARF